MKKSLMLPYCLRCSACCLAAQQNVTLSVSQHWTCSACPITVKAALKRVDGRERAVMFRYEERDATGYLRTNEKTSG